VSTRHDLLRHFQPHINSFVIRCYQLPANVWRIFEVEVGFGEVAKTNAGAIGGRQHNAQIVLHSEIGIRNAQLAIRPARQNRIDPGLIIEIAHSQRCTGTDREPVVDLIGRSGLQLGCDKGNPNRVVPGVHRSVGRCRHDLHYLNEPHLVLPFALTFLMPYAAHPRCSEKSSRLTL